MASIPLAIQTPPPISPMQNIGQLMQVRDAMSQIALRNAQTQQAQQQAANIEQEAATRRRGLEQRQKAQAVWSDPLNHEKFAQDDYSPFWQAGISPEVAEPLISASQKISTASQGLKAGKAEYHAKGRELWGSVLSNALEGDLTDPRSAEMLNSWKENTGKDYPDLAQQVPTFTAGPTLPDQIKSAMQQNATFLPYLTAKAARDKATADLTKTAADTAKANADALEATARKPLIDAEAGLKQLEFKSAQSITPESIQARAALMFNPANYTDPAVKAQVMAERRTAIDAATNAMGQGAPAVNAAFRDSSDRLGRLTSGIASAHAQAPIKIEVNAANAAARQAVLSPDEDITAAAIAAGKLAPETTRAALRRNPGLIGAVLKSDPNFDETNIDSRYQTLKQFTNTANSSAGGQVIALNTLIHHADLYQQVADSLKNGTFKPGNSVYNSVATMFGSAPPTQTNLVARFLAGETGKVATGGVPAEGEINGLLKSLDTNNSPDQIAKVGKTILQIAAGRAVPLMEKVKADHLENVVHVVGPDARGILAGRGFDPDTLKPVATSRATGGKIRARDANGNLHEAPAGTALPAGWKLEP